LAIDLSKINHRFTLAAEAHHQGAGKANVLGNQFLAG